VLGESGWMRSALVHLLKVIWVIPLSALFFFSLGLHLDSPYYHAIYFCLGYLDFHIDMQPSVSPMHLSVTFPWCDGYPSYSDILQFD
jgi:hypothetical protein